MTISLKESDISRIIEMAWEDRTPFDAIEATYGLNQNQVEDLMRDNSKKEQLYAMEKESPRKKNQTRGLERIWC